MTGETSPTQSSTSTDATTADRTCPNCGGPLDSISDCFTGPVSALDNFADVEDDLRAKGVVGREHPLVVEASDEDLADDDLLTAVQNRSGPFIQESIVCTETHCREGCGYSRRTWRPTPGADIELNDFDDLPEDVKAEAEELLEELNANLNEAEADR